MNPSAPLAWAELPYANCAGCGKRCQIGLSPFCRLDCERAHADRVNGAGYSAGVKAGRAARARIAAADARRAASL